MDRSSRNRPRRIAPFVAVAAVAALALAGCSSGSGGKKAEEDGGDGASAGKANTPQMTVALVTHQAPGDTFWDIVRKGAEAAAAKDNVKLIYSADPNAGNQANLVQNAIDQKVDGIAVTLAKPDALKGVLGKAEKAGIPVVGLELRTQRAGRTSACWSSSARTSPWPARPSARSSTRSAPRTPSASSTSRATSV
ncbi:hypothetical protein SHIRM173S_09300 [Streptomyces hirsutus]